MSRKKQKTTLDTSYNQPKNELQIKPQNKNFIPEFPLTNKYTDMHTPDSLQRFQWQLENSLLQKRQIKQYQSQTQNSRAQRRRAQTQFNDETEPEDEISANKLHKLQKQLSDLKGEISMSKSNGLESKLDRLLDQMVRNREADRQFFKQQRNSSALPQQPNNIFYPPMPYYPQNGYQRQKSRQKSSDRSRDKSQTRPIPRSQKKPLSRITKPIQSDDDIFEPKSQKKSATIFPKLKKNKLSKKLQIRKYFYAVLFTKFLRKEAQTLARARKRNFRNFFIEKFDSQITSLKDWLLEGQEYALPVILEKQSTNLQFWNQRSGESERQKQDLLLNLIKLGLQKMKKECVSHKITIFSQLLQRLCMRGSFVMSRFWSAYQLQYICISEFYGCIRADDSLEKFLLGMVIFVKMLIFNMIIQPHKFDSENFPKSNQKLATNMYVLGSAYYRLVKQVLRGYLLEKRPQYYKLGNWLNVKQQFLVQCCEPLRFNVRYPQQGQWISGLVGQELEILDSRSTWGTLKIKIQQIINAVHNQVKKKRKDSVRGQKHKLYN